MKSSESKPEKRANGVRIEKPIAAAHEDNRLWEEVRKYVRLIPGEPDPNLGRVQEIKEEILKGAYVTPEVIEETAARLAIRFMTKG